MDRLLRSVYLIKSACSFRFYHSGKRTDVKFYVGQFYVLCVDISESMTDGYAWQQAKKFVESFISGRSLRSSPHLGFNLRTFRAFNFMTLLKCVTYRYCYFHGDLQSVFENQSVGKIQE